MIAAAGPPALVVRDLRAGYGPMEAVSGISFEVAAGEVVSMIGRNGAGKTTSLMAVAGIRAGQNSGTVSVNGVDVSRSRAPQIVRTGLAHVPEGHRIFRSLTVDENLRLGAFSVRRGRAAAVADSLERVRTLFPILRTYADRNAGFLSGGEQQMVAIGQALMAKPTVIMLDEPTSGLALPVVARILEVIAQLKDDGLAIVMVEQSVTRALSHSDRCLVVERGHIVVEGPSAVLAQDPTVPEIVRGTARVELSDPAEPPDAVTHHEGDPHVDPAQHPRP